MSQVTSPESEVVSHESEVDLMPEISDAEQSIDPLPEELAVLSRMERFIFLQAHEMNQGRWKRLWTWWQCSPGIGTDWQRWQGSGMSGTFGGYWPHSKWCKDPSRYRKWGRDDGTNA